MQIFFEARKKMQILERNYLHLFLYPLQIDFRYICQVDISSNYTICQNCSFDTCIRFSIPEKRGGYTEKYALFQIRHF